MKKRVTSIIVAAVLLMAFGFVLSGCKTPEDPTPDTYDLIPLEWRDYDGTTYEVEKAGGKMTVDYFMDAADSSEWAHFRTSIINADYDLNAYKTLVVKVKPTYTHQAEGSILLKFEGTKAAEVKVYIGKLSTNEPDAQGYYSFKWDLSTINDVDFNEEINFMRIFVEPGRFSAAGRLEFAELYMTKTAAGTTGTVVSAASTNRKTDPQINTLTYAAGNETVDGDWSFNSGWVDGSGENTHSFNATTKAMTVNKVGYPWANATVNLASVPAKYKYAVMVVKGTSAITSKSVILKAEGTDLNKEKAGVFINDNEITIQVNLDDKIPTTMRIMAFAGDRGVVNASFTIVEAYLSTTAVVAENIVPPNVYDGTSATFNVTQNWKAMNENDWEIEGNTFKKASDETYSALITELKNMKDGFTKIDFGFTASNGANVLLKLEGDGFTAIELPLTGTGAAQTGTITIPADSSKIQRVVIFVLNKNHTITLTSAVFSKA